MTKLSHPSPRPLIACAVAAVLLAGALGGCSWLDARQSGDDARPPQDTQVRGGDDGATGADAPRSVTSQTPAVRAYRKLGANAIYKKYPQRIYRGRIPPLVYAVVVVETEIDASGKVMHVGFSRVPSHAPEVPPKIAALIRDASPLPNPGKLGAHTYIDTWLWDRSGRFQLDTLTQGQRSR